MNTCDECGSNSFHWNYTSDIVGGVVQGRLNTSDIKPVFYLSCECGADIQTATVEEVLEALDSHKVIF